MSEDFLLDTVSHNSMAWDRHVENGSVWTKPINESTIEAARNGDWTIYLSPIKPLPAAWLPDPQGLDILCLAGGGGQQGPVLAAAGASVTVFDNSMRQLEQDRLVASREGLKLTTIQGDMRDLSAFADNSFDVIVHPVSNLYIPSVLEVWREAHRVLRPNGSLLAAFCNPVVFLFQNEEVSTVDELRVTHRLPYSDIQTLSEEQKRKCLEDQVAFNFGHTLEDQIGGQIAAGFAIVGFYEDGDQDGDNTLSNYIPTYICTKSLKTA